MVHDSLDLIRLDEDSLEPSTCHSASREVEHISPTEEILSSDSIEYRTRVYTGCYSEGYT